MSSIPLSINELKESLFLLKLNKSPGYDEKNFNAIKRCFRVLHVPLQYLFDISLTSGVFPDVLKIPRGTQNISNYRPISALPCFSKTGHSTEHPITYLADQIHESIEKDCFTLCIFIDLLTLWIMKNS